MIALPMLLLLGAGCDLSGMTSDAPTAICGRIGERCQLPEGPLGVCLDKPCAEGQSPPCFACTPQH